jgi:predicted DNA-binding protein
MGRPPMNVKPTVVRLSQEALDRIEKVAGPNQRAAFIREAVENELDRRDGQSQNSVQTDGDDGERR